MAQPRHREPVVVEPVVNREKLLELLALETEYATLDFKEGCDLAEKRDQVELAKDVAAMSVRGGFLIIGVDGHGKSTGKLTAQHATLFDSARLRPKLLKWLPESLEICSQTHEIDGQLVCLVHVAPNPAGCVFIRANGQYDQPGAKQSKELFRQGEVFFRNGTESTRLNQHGLEEVVRQRVEQERAKWEKQHAATYQRLADELRAGAVGSRVARGSSVEFNLTLEPDVLIEAAVELLRANDDIPFKRMLRRVVPEARDLYTNSDQDGIARLLDRLTCLAATFLDLDRRPWFERVVDTLMSIYGLGFENIPPIINQPPPQSAELWLATVERIMALGSLAVSREDWAAVRYLASQRHPEMNAIYSGWLRHAMTMAARSGLLTYGQGSSENDISLLSLAREVVRRLDCLRPDFAPDDDQILTNLAQFDFLGCLVALANVGNESVSGVVYPSFARFYSTRAQPITQRLLREPEMRQILYPHEDDSHLAQSLQLIDEIARREGFRFDGWDGYTGDVATFIQTHISGRG